MIPPRQALEQVARRGLTWAAGLDWRLRLRGRPLYGPALQQMAQDLPRWLGELEDLRPKPRGRRILLFATHDRWIYLTALLALTLAARGNQVGLAYLPYPNWFTPFSFYGLRQRDAAYFSILRRLQPWARVFPLLLEPEAPLPPALQTAVEETTFYDMQYTLQREDVPSDHPLWGLRRARNRQAAARMLHLLRRWKPHVVVTPNGLILEFGMVYHAARAAGVPVVTYEFDEQKDHAWMVRDAVVMHLPVDDLWQRYRERPLTPDEAARIRKAMEDRWQGRIWERSERRWQDVPPQGSQQAAQALGLDPTRPIVLLAPNVFGDSVVLGRQVFSQGMTDWLQRTIAFFLARPQAQLVIRVHPGEKHLGPEGLSMAQVAREALRGRNAENVFIVEAQAPINTFDLVPLAAAGLVYTSTVGLEMVLQGVPVVVAGQAFYRGKGFTLDPRSWDEYFTTLQRLLEAPETLRPDARTREMAWRFAYLFFYRFPKAFPWHLHHVTEQASTGGRTPRWALQRPEYEPTWQWLETP